MEVTEGLLCAGAKSHANIYVFIYILTNIYTKR